MPIWRRWRAQFLAWRNALFASTRFQDAASRFALTQGLARRHANRLFDLGAGFVYAQIYVACVELKLFQLLASRPPQSSLALASALGLSPAAAQRLLRAAAPLGLVEEIGADHYMLGPLGAAFLGAPGVEEIVLHHRALYADLADPVGLLRADRAAPTALSDYWRYDPTGPAPEAATYSALMAASQAQVAAQAISSLPWRRVRRLMDVGGGAGAFIAAIAARYPHLAFDLVDLPGPLAAARGYLAQAGIAPRVRLHEADMLSADLPRGADAASLVRVLHDHDDGPALDLLRRIRAALPPGGRLFVIEPMRQARGAPRFGDCYFGFYLWAMGRGEPRSPRQLTDMLRAAGFAAVKRVATPLPLAADILIARL